MGRRSTNAANEGCAMALGALFLLAVLVLIIKWVLIIAAFAVPIVLLVLAGRHLYLRHQHSKTAARRAFDEYHRQAAQAADEQQRRAIEAQCTVAAWQPPAELEQRYQRVMGGRHRTGFDPSDPSYHGAGDPGRVAGGAPTSGETQHDYGCQQGYIPASEC